MSVTKNFTSSGFIVMFMVGITQIVTGNLQIDCVFPVSAQKNSHTILSSIEAWHTFFYCAFE
ncbi:hypothetical protein EfmAA290_18240 [Enterococcus faecium]|nr:hypothetical protein EfmAA290_18240 [Enterococcus faecium]